MTNEEAGCRLSRVALLVELLADEMRALDGVEVNGKTLDAEAVTGKLIEKSFGDESLTNEEVSELQAMLLRLSEQPSDPPRPLEPPQPSCATTRIPDGAAIHLDLDTGTIAVTPE